MPSLFVPEVGEVQVRKSSRAKRLILKIDQSGQPVVVVPARLSLKLANRFVLDHTEWLKTHVQTQQTQILKSGDRIGRHHRLEFKAIDADQPRSHVGKTIITISYPANQSPGDPAVQAEAIKAATRAVKRQADALLPRRLHELAQQHGYTYQAVKVRAMHSRWGSCSSRGVITLSSWLVQVPDNLVEYVLCHELAHLRHRHHQAAFWQEVITMVGDYKPLRRALKSYQPALKQA